MEKDKLKPCPWCQCDDELSIAENYNAAYWEWWSIWCSNCAVMGPRAETREQAITYWNERQEAQYEKDIRQLERQLEEVRDRISRLDQHYPTAEQARRAGERLSRIEDEILEAMQRIEEAHGKD